MKAKTNFYAVMLAGGSGMRFWPLSTENKPKQFLTLFTGKSLLQQCADRLCRLTSPDHILAVTTQTLVPQTVAELQTLPCSNIIGEPERRDTCAAVALGVGMTEAEDDDVIGFFPADCLIADAFAFVTCIKIAIDTASRCDDIVVIGVSPTRPATEFGYVDPSCGRFVEKPVAAAAQAYITQGYLWNAGMFIGKASSFRAAFSKHAPEFSRLAAGCHALPSGKLAATYATLPRISFDFAVMERLPHITVIRADFGWDDVGSYAAVDRHFPHDANGNVVSGVCRLADTHDCICISTGAPASIIGLRDIAVIVTENGVLVADKSRTDELKAVVSSGV